MRSFYPLIGCLMLFLATPQSRAEEFRVAVVMAFLETLQQIKPLFEQETGHTFVITYASAGVLFQKIKSGEPIDVFLSSDEEHPKKLIQEGLAIPDSFFVYALGRLVLWTNSALPLNEKTLLKINRLALPDPRDAPYGRAAQQVLEGLHLWEQMQPKIHLVKTTTEAYQETLEKKSEAGFISLSQYLSSLNNLGTHSWIIPQYLHCSISHSAVILKATKHPTAARAFLKFLRHPAALKVIREFGFRIPSQPKEDD